MFVLMNEFKGRFITALNEKVKLPDGQVTEIDCVKHPGGACVLPIDKDGSIILLKQWRAPIKKYIWEIPAGKLDAGENPLTCAKRELEEEAGLTAGNWKKLISFFTTPGFCNELLHIYIATDLKKVATNQEAHEIIEIHKLKPQEIEELINKKEIEDSKTLIALLMYKNKIS